jgi:molybdopterin/thiamine biosynthesis adenylyltransferase
LYQEGEDDLTCAANGVLSPLVGVIGSLQALEAVKIIVGFGQPLAGRVLLFDGRYSQWREIKLPRDTGCPICAARR